MSLYLGFNGDELSSQISYIVIGYVPPNIKCESILLYARMDDLI